MKKMQCPACGTKLKESGDYCYDEYGELMNGNTYRCPQCAVTVVVPF